jgi:hypothetical protein
MIFAALTAGRVLDYADISLTRQTRTNYRFLVKAEQTITNDQGLFSRASWDAGHTEKIGWTDCDENFSVGPMLKCTLEAAPMTRSGSAA